MEYIKCNSCGADDAKFILRAKRRHDSKGEKFFKLTKCRNCELVYLNPRPEREEIKDYYPPSYHSRAQSKIVDIEKTEIWGIPWREAMQKKAAPILRYKKSGRILDVGCGDGSLLKFLKELGWETYGVEFQGSASRYAREVLGLNVFSGRLEEANYPEGYFDVITLLHVLEHLPDPSAILKKAHKLLRKDGFLLIEVPNFGSFEAHIFRSKWMGISAPLHLYHFTPLTLQKMLKSCGYIPIEVGFIPEQTKYVAGYSEGLRYCLMDLGLYPSKQKDGDMKIGESYSVSNYSWINPLHLLEYLIFLPVAHFMDKIGLGSNLMCIARKKSL
jgi:2-polyprenyl-3-methyl-5-hydroxy-6-metoxy-1,4-benzoquinol methylase